MWLQSTILILESFTLQAPAGARRKAFAANLWLALAAEWIGLAASRLSGPSGAALYSRGWLMLPGLIMAIFLPVLQAAFSGAVVTGPPALLLAAAALLQAVAGATLMRRWVDPAIASGRAVLRFVLLDPLICCIRATLSIAVLALHRRKSPSPEWA